jgi:hypothetical protein
VVEVDEARLGVGEEAGLAEVTSSTSGESGSMVTAKSAPSTASAPLPAALPLAATRADTPPGERS